MRLHLLFLLIACVYHGVSYRLAIWMTRQISYWFTKRVFSHINDNDLEDAWKQMYSQIGKDQQVSVKREGDVIYVTTVYCHLYAMCLKYKMPEIIQGFCLGDSDYWRKRLGNLYWKDTQFVNHDGICRAWLRVN